MKKLKYSPDYTEKMRELRKYLDFQLGGDVRKRVIKEIGSSVRSLSWSELILLGKVIYPLKGKLLYPALLNI